MKIAIGFVALCSLLLIPSSAGAATPEFELPVAIQSGGQDIGAPGGHSTVEVVDWNNDGKKDLLVGQHTNAYIQLYLNVGTDSNPSFDGGALLMVNGNPLRVGST